jgi:hypothetical protein
MYKIINENAVQRIADGAYIPVDTENMDYCEYLKWLEEGNQPEPIEVNSPDSKAVAKTALETLERTTMMNKGMREFFLVSMQDMAVRQSEKMDELGIDMPPQLILANHKAWVELVAIHARASQLEKEANS